MIPIFTGSVDNGGLKFDRRSSVDEYIGTLIGQRVEVVIRKPKTTRAAEFLHITIPDPGKAA
jgi:uncharacterized protein YcbX